MSNKKIEFGDFQTPYDLAEKVVELVENICPDPSNIVEPTCGVGNFVKACLGKFGESSEHYGFDVNQEYVCKLSDKLQSVPNCHIKYADFFTKDWSKFFAEKAGNWLLIGNPPWVTNSVLGSLKSNNLPIKSNLQGLNGFATKTGKGNFDITEWMLIKLIDSLQNSSACLAMLCKTATARKVLRYFWNNDAYIYNSSIHKINAAKHFDVAVDACLFLTLIGDNRKSKDAVIFDDLSFTNKIHHLGVVNKELVSEIDLYNTYCSIDGNEDYGWRSGLKHDAAKVMELEYIDGKYKNGFNEIVELEDKYLYPLLKSSDIGNQRLHPRKYVIVTQKKVSDNTFIIEQDAPKTWRYLEKYSEKLDNRKSIIYKKRPRFSVFGVGDYSFTPWKVAISGFYKNTDFSVVGNVDGKSIMVDDTCYILPCENKEEATLICDLLNSEPCQKFISSLIFFDSKRPVNIDLLKRIDLLELAKVCDAKEVENILSKKLIEKLPLLGDVYLTA